MKWEEGDEVERGHTCPADGEGGRGMLGSDILGKKLEFSLQKQW